MEMKDIFMKEKKNFNLGISWNILKEKLKMLSFYIREVIIDEHYDEEDYLIFIQEMNEYYDKQDEQARKNESFDFYKNYQDKDSF
jgi:hypothetical protein